MVVSSETVSFLRPFARRAANTLRPLAVAILWRKPCLFILFLREGWKVLFMVYIFFDLFLNQLAECKGKTILSFPKKIT